MHRHETVAQVLRGILHHDFLPEDPRIGGSDPVRAAVHTNENASLRDNADDFPNVRDSSAVDYLRVEVLLRANLNDLIAAVRLPHVLDNLLGENPEVVFPSHGMRLDSLSGGVQDNSLLEPA
jgi:hypothetical protein